MKKYAARAGGAGTVALLAFGITAFAVTGGPSSPTPEAPPTPTATVHLNYPDADEERYLGTAQTSWQGEQVPQDSELLEVGYYRCSQSPEDRFEQQDNFWPDWSGSNNMTLGFLALTHLCPAD